MGVVERSWVDRGPDDRSRVASLVDERRDTVRDGVPHQVLAQLLEILVSEHLVRDPVHRSRDAAGSTKSGCHGVGWTAMTLCHWSVWVDPMVAAEINDQFDRRAGDAGRCRYAAVWSGASGSAGPGRRSYGAELGP